MKILGENRNNSRVALRRRGTALVAALFAAIVAASMVAILMTVSHSRSKHVNVDRHSATARYMAEGALEVAKKELQVAIANWSPVPVGGIVEINGQDVAYATVATGLDTLAMDSAGIQTMVTGYELRAVGQSLNSTGVVNRIINAQATPIFQFAVFYDNDLEIFPGPDMTLGGRVHTNGDMYLGSGSTLTVNSNYLHSVGGIYRARKDDPTDSSGTVKVRKWVENPYDVSEPEEYVNMYSSSEMAGFGVTTDSGYDSAFTSGLDINGDGDFYDADEWLPWGPGALETWKEPLGYAGGHGNTVMSDSHGVTEAVVADIESIAMYEEKDGGSYRWDAGTQTYVPSAPGAGTHDPGFFHANADLSIITYDDGSWDAFDGTGISVKALLSTTVKQYSLYDARQASGSGTNTPVTEIDIDKLNASGAFPSNGLLYAAHYGMGTGTDAKGILLKNGEELKAPLSVVSEGSIYVQGDYNTVRKKGASVMADAVNLLSNSWDGRKAPGELPGASETTYNAAIVMGNHESHVGRYNGGLENLPRFHEKWSGVPCNIKGSFVNTWYSRFATGIWKYGGDRYQAPGRNWHYDSDFNTVANLPPFTPMAVTADEVVTW